MLNVQRRPWWKGMERQVVGKELPDARAHKMEKREEKEDRRGNPKKAAGSLSAVRPCQSSSFFPKQRSTIRKEDEGSMKGTQGTCQAQLLRVSFPLKSLCSADLY